jgi:hypothetical protein
MHIEPATSSLGIWYAIENKPRRENLWVTGVPAGAYNHVAG